MRKAFIIIFILSLIFTSCNPKGNTNSQSAINVSNWKEEIPEMLTELKSKGVINDLEYKQLTDRLSADCDTYLASRDMTCSEITDMGMKALSDFDNIKLTEEVYSVIWNTYSTIAKSNQVRNILSVKEYCNPVEKMSEWYEARKTPEDKIVLAQNRLKMMVTNAADNKNITLKGMDSIAAAINSDIELIKKNIQDSSYVYEVLYKGVNRFGNKNLDNSIIMDIGNVYYALSKVCKKNFQSVLDKFFENNLKQPEPLTYETLKESVEGRLGWMLEEDLINKKDYETLKSTMLNDIDTFLKGSQSKEQLTERVQNSLAKLKSIELDTEDREFVAETYYDIAKRCDIDIAKDLNKWLYGIDID